jgi:hypothetical protein
MLRAAIISGLSVFFSGARLWLNGGTSVVFRGYEATVLA